MSTPTVPISETSHRLLEKLGRQTGQTPAEVIEKALDAYHWKVFFEQLNAGYAALQADPEAWAEELEERKLWEATLMDGLDPEERWSEDGRCLTPEQEQPE